MVRVAAVLTDVRHVQHCESLLPELHKGLLEGRVDGFLCRCIFLNMRCLACGFGGPLAGLHDQSHGQH